MEDVVGMDLILSGFSNSMLYFWSSSLVYCAIGSTASIPNCRPMVLSVTEICLGDILVIVNGPFYFCSIWTMT